MRIAIKVGVLSALLAFFFVAPIVRVEAYYSLPTPPPLSPNVITSDCPARTVQVTHWESLGYYIFRAGYQYVLTRIPHCGDIGFNQLRA